MIQRGNDWRKPSSVCVFVGSLWLANSNFENSYLPQSVLLFTDIVYITSLHHWHKSKTLKIKFQLGIVVWVNIDRGMPSFSCPFFYLFITRTLCTMPLVCSGYQEACQNFMRFQLLIKHFYYPDKVIKFLPGHMIVECHVWQTQDLYNQMMYSAATQRDKSQLIRR